MDLRLYCSDEDTLSKVVEVGTTRSIHGRGKATTCRLCEIVRTHAQAGITLGAGTGCPTIVGSIAPARAGTRGTAHLVCIDATDVAHVVGVHSTSKISNNDG